jgi:PBP1b-binding outer membrane lipoprotein LpoB
MKGMIKTGCLIIFAGLFFVGCATTDPCVNILQEKPLEPGIKMNSVTILDSSLYYEMIGATYCNGVQIASATATQQNPVARYKVTVEQTESRRTATGTMEVLTILRNHTNFPLQIEGRTQFFDHNKSPVEDMSPWQRVQLPPKSIGTYKTVSNKREEVEFFYIEIREGR